FAEFSGNDRNIWRVDWHPDGKRISIWGTRKPNQQEFLTAPIDGSAPVKSEISAEMEKQRRDAGIALADFRWASSGRALYFEGVANGVRNLWKIEVDPQSLRWLSEPERLTVGAGVDADIALSPDGKKLAFVTRTEHTRVWSFTFNPATNQV